MSNIKRGGSDHVLAHVMPRNACIPYRISITEHGMSNINATSSAPVKIDKEAEAITYWRQQHCKHAMVKGRCDKTERCVHCGISMAEWEVRPK